MHYTRDEDLLLKFKSSKKKGLWDSSILDLNSLKYGIYLPKTVKFDDSYFLNYSNFNMKLRQSNNEESQFLFESYKPTSEMHPVN